MKTGKIVDAGLLFVLFFLVNMLIGLPFLKEFYESTFSAFSSLPSFHAFLHMTVLAFTKAVHLSDMDSYASNALYFSKHHSFMHWMLNLWPPGESFMLFLVLSVTGGYHYPLTMFIVGVTLWSIVFVVVYYSLFNIKNVVLKIIISGMPLYFLIFCRYAFGSNLFMAEGPSLPLFVIMACFLIKYLQFNKMRDMVITAVLLGILAYFRGYFELFGMFLLIIFIGVLIITKIKKEPVWNQRTRIFAIGLFVFNMVLLPWRLHNFHEDHSLSWQHLEAGTWLGFWDPANPWPTGNIPCHIKPDWCQFFYKKDIKAPNPIFSANFYRNNTLMVYIEHPIKWYGQKIRHFNDFWIDGKQVGRALYLFPEGVLTLLMGFSSIIIGCFFWRNKLLPQAHVFSQFCLGFVLFNMGLFTFFHYETRYSLYLQVLFMYLPFWLVGGFKKK